MTILEITCLARFKHFKLQQNHSQYAYSTCIIQNILHPSYWKQPFHKAIQFPISYHVKLGKSIVRTYAYWYYQQAWFNTFFL